MSLEGAVDVSSSRLERLFQDDRTFWPIAAWVGGMVAVCKGLAAPNRWSATQAQVDYHFGFVKRGLFGQAFAAPLGLAHYSHFAVFAGVILLAFLLLLGFYTRASGVGEKLGGYQVAALFFSSYGVTYVADLIGYLDIVLGVLAVTLLAIPRPGLRFVIALPCLIVAPLVHENFLLILLPVVLLSFFLESWAGGAAGSEAKGDRTPPGRVVTVGIVAALALVAVATTVWISLRPSLSAERAQQMQERTTSLVDFEIRPDFFQTMVRSAEDNAVFMKEFYRLKWWQRENAISVAIFGPTVAILILMTLKVIRESPALPAGAAVVATIAAMSPLSMHLLGADAARWNAWVVVTSYLVLLTVCRAAGPRPVVVSAAWRNVMVLAIMLSMASGSLLLDGRTDRSFPFFHKGSSLGKLSPGKVAPDF